MRRIGSAVLGLSLAGFSLWGSAADGQVPAANRAVLGAWGVDLSGMDRSVKPGDDFFRYVNGAWFDTAEIPPDRTTTGSFVQLDVQSETRVRGILSELEARSANLSPEEKQVRDLYTSYVDTERLERLGLEPARRDLAAIAGLRTHEDVARAMASPELGTESIFDVRIGVDDKNPDAYAVFIRQSGLGLPDRDYYRLERAGHRHGAREIPRLHRRDSAPGRRARSGGDGQGRGDLQARNRDRRHPLVEGGPARCRQDLQSDARVRIGAVCPGFPLGSAPARERDRQSAQPASVRSSSRKNRRFPRSRRCSRAPRWIFGATI